MNRELPVGWEWTEVKEISELIRGVTYKSIDSSSVPKKDYFPILRANNIEEEINFDGLIYVPEKQINDKQMIKPFDILIAMSSGSKNLVGKAAQIKVNFLGSFGTFCALVRPSQSIDKKYLGLFFQSSRYRSRISQLSRGVNINNLRREHIESMKIPLPPLETQRKIVTIFEKAEDTKKSRERADELTNQLLQSVFLEMFGDPIKNPMNWKMIRLDDACEKIQDGTHFSPKEQAGEIPYITAKNIRPWGIDLTDITYLPKIIHEQIYQRCDPRKGDVIYIKDGVTAGLAKVNSLDFEFSMLSSIAMIRPKKSILNSYYLEYYLNHPSTYKRIMERKSGSAITRLILREIKDIKILLPPFELQKKFAHIVENTEIIKQSQKKSNEEIDNLFNVIMQKAFTGELVA